jgi:hypothetical protein
MNVILTTKKHIFLITAALVLLVLLFPSMVSAQRVQTTVTCDNGQTATFDDGSTTAQQACQAIGSTYGSKNYDCGEGSTIQVPAGYTEQQARLLCPKSENTQKVYDLLQDAINLMAVLAGLAITGSVIVGGIQYSTAGGNPQATAKAKARITNAMIALLTLVFLYSFLQWLVPGGVFND